MFAAEEERTPPPPGKKGEKGAVQPPPQISGASPTLNSQEIPTQDVEKYWPEG